MWDVCRRLLVILILVCVAVVAGDLACAVALRKMMVSPLPVNQSEFHCFWCKATGHLKRQCRYYHRWLDSQKSPKRCVKNAAESGCSCISQKIRIKLEIQTNNSTVKSIQQFQSNDGTVSDIVQRMLQRLGLKLQPCKWDVCVDGYGVLPDDPMTVLENNDRVTVGLRDSSATNKHGKRTHSQGVQCRIRAGYASRGIQCENGDISISKREKSDKYRIISEQNSADPTISIACQTDAESIADTEVHRGYTSTMTSDEVKNILKLKGVEASHAGTCKKRKAKKLSKFRCSERLINDNSDDEFAKHVRSRTFKQFRDGKTQYDLGLTDYKSCESSDGRPYDWR